MQKIKITSGGWEVLANGYVHSNGLSPIDFELTKDMILRLAITSVPGDPPSIELEPEGNYLTITYKNPKQVANFGAKEPIEIGLYNGRSLFVQARISVYGEYTSFSASYTFYLGVEHG